ncbi:AttM/AiiB family protein [Bradyrhizobium diazoefficiens]|uniref:AttM/AiiB family protein n=1 Tax=Bradyrhizobium diazoefficiens TaxID=1355477 RepID=A0A0E4BY45_9BRAD|nr:AttM/AiiB family protein [Bradyrhizobium diazoefficiens]
MTSRIKLAFAAAALALFSHAAMAQSEKPGVERLYVLNCGEGTAGDISRWTPGLNEGKSMDFVDSCYLVKHAKGWFLWDTGIADSVAAMPNGLVPADPKAVTWRRPKTLAAQLEQLGVKPDDVKAMAVSHTHPDHSGNVELFPQAVLYVQKAEYDWPGANNEPRFKPSHPVEQLAGDKDVFGDGSVTILSTPGHTPGHQSLLVKLPKTGAVIAISMDGKGAWRDNVFVERLWRTVKYEEVYLRAYDSVSEARASIAKYLAFYNQGRPHSSLDGRTPDEAYFGTQAMVMAA